MASTRAIVHAVVDRGLDASQVLGTVNGFLCRDMPEEFFLSLFIGILDPEHRTFEYASAGHNPPILRRADGTLEDLGRTGPVLGVLPEARYRTADPVRLAAGDVMVLYTDGIYEAHDPAGEIWGEDRFRAAVGEGGARAPSARALLEGVLADLEAFRRDRELDDDVTCLVLRVT
jgi:sigma-B regulation protein RsbU (phosphoserine phosphatase)